MLLELAIVIITLAVFSVISYRKKLLDGKGVLVGIIVGLLSFFLGEIQGFSGLALFLVMVFFFIFAEFCTRYARAIMFSQHETRTTGNILGNSGAALIGLALGQPIAFFGAMSAALSDTLSSEVGLLSKNQPFLITSFKKVSAGTDGAVTVMGWLGGLTGAVMIAAIYYLLTANTFAFIAITIAGFFGGIADSIVGATLERKRKINNTMVNFIAGCTGAVIAFVLTIGIGV